MMGEGEVADGHGVRPGECQACAERQAKATIDNEAKDASHGVAPFLCKTPESTIFPVREIVSNVS
jgi:hypothetical protein